MKRRAATAAFCLVIGGSPAVEAAGICPQPRNTAQAPERYSRAQNPLTRTPGNVTAGKELYLEKARPTPCKLCHGLRGDGNGRLAEKLVPPPRNFTCRETMKDVTDGQMFWIVKNGSRGTAMPAHKAALSDNEIWRLILYLRRFAPLNIE
ncbi:MAG: c-type cytochrome [Nitrospinae bacterium]|nr:c-type cytochrome [Nitrospinota bacterium]